MYIEVNRKQFTAALTNIARIVEKKNTLPILTGVPSRGY